MIYEAGRLRELATQVEYEVATLFGQVDALIRRPRDPSDPVYLALVEAPLVHLRLLDDFLGQDLPKPNTRHEDDVVARHFLPDWTPERFLPDATRDAINAQLQHLVSRREVGANWHFPSLLTALAHRFLEFANELADCDRDRVDWFEVSIECCWWVLDDSEAADRYPNVLHGS